MDYTKDNLSLLPHGIMHALGVKSKREFNVNIPDSNKILFILVDGLRADLIKSSYKINSIFPSTTAAALTTIATGLTPREHGLIEWFIYCKKIDDVIASLPMVIKETGESVDLKKSDLFDGKPIFEKIKSNGINSFSYLPDYLVDTQYTKYSLSGSEVKGYKFLGDLTAKVVSDMKKYDGLFYIYLPFIDSVEHELGYDSIENSFSVEFLKIWLKFLKRKLGGIEHTFVLTADHGQVKMSKFVNLRRFSFFNEIKFLTGSPRDLFIFGDFDISKLKKKLSNYATVIPSYEALNFMGTGRISKKTKIRIGNFLILPKDSYFIWDKRKFVGMHGGLSEEEIKIPLIIERR